ncbi:hypothetical protein V462_11050 [Pantoea ananatis 15320]|uniref:hypothetical protein n=1 Tax=Pantoea ananas TaxID=553 RepID=UPI0003F4C54D|nr:hypothetical protein [Pantoea ananatis]PKC36131.1 hypothetical protein V462_11050 [Pantoea ananatis 15320]
MKIRLLTALVAAGCFSQMAMADNLLTGSITDETTATGTVTLTQKITLENTLTPLQGLKAGTSTTTLETSKIATGNLKIKEAGVKARLAIEWEKIGNQSFATYATGHENDDQYKLEYNVYPILTDSDTIFKSDGIYVVSKTDVSSLDYVVKNKGLKLPKAGDFVISVTGAVYNP